MTRCCELCSKATHAEVMGALPGDKHEYNIIGLTEAEEKEFENHQCLKYVNVHEVMLQSDVSLFWNITVPNNYYRYSWEHRGASGKVATCTCPDGSSFAVGAKGPWGATCSSSTEFACEGGTLTETCRWARDGESRFMRVTCGGRGLAKIGNGPNDGAAPSIFTKTTVPRNELRDLDDPLSMHEIVSLFADEQQTWADEFAATVEKMLTNGVYSSTLAQSFEFGPDVQCKVVNGRQCSRSEKGSCVNFDCPFSYADIEGKAGVNCKTQECTLEECCVYDSSRTLHSPTLPKDNPDGFVFLGHGLCLTTFNSPHHFNMKGGIILAKCAELCRQDGDACWAFSAHRNACRRFARDSVLGDCGDGFRALALENGAFSFGKVSVTEAENSVTEAENSDDAVESVKVETP